MTIRWASAYKAHTNVPEVDGDHLQSIYCSVGPGWHPLLEATFERLLIANWNGELEDIKSKFGGLRLYLAENSTRLNEICLWAENASFSICERCGAPGKPYRPNRGGWVETLCAAHRKYY
jgi:hypothetical protein